MNFLRAATGAIEVTVGFGVATSGLEILNNSGHDGLALLAAIGATALGIDGILRTAEGVLKVDQQKRGSHA